MSDILVKCPNCGGLNAPRDECPCISVQPDAPEIPDGIIYDAVPSLPNMVQAPLAPLLHRLFQFGAQVKGSDRHAKVVLAVVGGVFAAIALGSLVVLAPAPPQHTSPAAPDPVRRPLAQGVSEGEVTAWVPVRMASGRVELAPWSSEEPIEVDAEALRDALERVSVNAAVQYEWDVEYANRYEPAEVAPEGFVLFDRPGLTPSRAETEAEPVKPSAKKPAPAKTAQKPPAPAPPPKKDEPPAPAPKVAGPAPGIVDLGTLGGKRSFAYDINQDGVVVGRAQTAGGAWHAFVWSDGTMRDLGGVLGESYAHGIADDGTIVGYSHEVGEPETPRGVRWSADGDSSELDALPTRANHCGVAIGPAGLIAGWGVAGGGRDSVAVCWDGSRILELPPFGGESAAYDVNGLGEVVGYGSVDGTRHALVWRSGAIRDELSELWPGPSEGRGINAQGHVVGFTVMGPDQRKPFLYRKGDVTHLATPEGFPWAVARGINGSDVAVGYAWAGSGENRNERAVMWRGDAVIDLNDLVDDAWKLTRARRINDRGQVVATGLVDGESHAFVLNLKQ